MIWYTGECSKSSKKEIFVSYFYEECDFKVEVKDAGLLNKTSDEQIFFTDKENLIYLEG